MARESKTKNGIMLLFSTLLALHVAEISADARTSRDAQSAAELRKGMAAFHRQDYTAAGLLLRSPAERGDAGAQAILCYLHTYGRGVPQSFRAAANWCRRAAEQGNAQAQYMLGLLYNKGHGVPEDYVQAYKWLNAAAARASGPKREFSYRIRDSVATKMSPAQRAKAQALAIEWRPVPELQGSASLTGACAGDEKCLDR
jgi:TPR repeat protein